LLNLTLYAHSANTVNKPLDMGIASKKISRQWAIFVLQTFLVDGHYIKQ